MIKKILLIVSLLWIANSLFSQSKELVLNGQVNTSDRNGQSVYLLKMDIQNLSQLQVLDSTVIIENKFSFKTVAPDNLGIRMIEIGEKSNNPENLYGLFIAEPGTIEISVDSTVSVKGSVINQKHNEFQRAMTDFSSQMIELQKNYSEITSDSQDQTEDALKSWEEKAIGIRDKMLQIILDYIKPNMTNGVGEFYFLAFLPQLSPEQSEELLELASPEFQSQVKSIMQAFAPSQSEEFEPTPFVGIELMTDKGQKENIDKHIGKGKIVLIDFWASWCGPCRKDMPELVSLYKEYKDKNFEIIGISLDSDEQSWKEAISSMNMTWPQYSDLGGWNSIAAERYGIDRIPRTFIIDTNGMIIAQDLRGKELKNKIEELLIGN